MELVVIDRSRFELWRRMRRELYSGLDDEFHDREMERIAQSSDREGWFAVESEQIVGFLELSLRNVVDGCLGEPVGYLDGIYLRPEHRGGGRGRWLVEQVAAWARTRGCSELATDAELDDPSAQAFHRALGFEETWRIVQFRRAL